MARHWWEILLLIAGLFFFANGTLVFLAHSGTNFYLFHFFAGLILLGLYAAQRKGLLVRLPRPVLAALAAVFLIGLAVLAVCLSLIFSQFKKSAPAGLDYLLVLGAQVHSEDRASVVLQYRLDTAAAYLEKNPETVCIVTGGQGPNEPCPEAVTMRNILEARGIDPSRILSEEKAGNTLENIRFSYELIGPEAPERTIGIVTNNFHMYRACAIARRQGGVKVYAESAPSTPMFLLSNLLRECLGILKDKVMGNL